MFDKFDMTKCMTEMHFVDIQNALMIKNKNPSFKLVIQET